MAITDRARQMELIRMLLNGAPVMIVLRMANLLLKAEVDAAKAELALGCAQREFDKLSDRYWTEMQDGEPADEAEPDPEDADIPPPGGGGRY
jgi:hypothetical protein